jgi:hypothetical protein
MVDEMAALSETSCPPTILFVTLDPQSNRAKVGTHPWSARYDAFLEGM